MVRGALEHHVLQQMRHAGFAIALKARADHIGDVDGYGGLGVIGEQQHLEAVGEAILGDAFDRGDLGWSGDCSRGWGWGLGKGEAREKSKGRQNPHGIRLAPKPRGRVVGSDAGVGIAPRLDPPHAFAECGCATKGIMDYVVVTG